MKWLRNALITLMREAARAELLAQRASELAHVTELVSVLHKATDELTHALSREAMRKARQLDKQKKESEGDPAAVVAAPSQPEGLTPKQSARLRWQRMTQASQSRGG